MSDPRHTKLAEILVHYSCELKEGDKVLIEAVDIPHAFTTELIRAASEAGAQPFVTLKNQSVWQWNPVGSSPQGVPVPVLNDAVPLIGFAVWERQFDATPEANYGRAIDHSYGSALALPDPD